MIDKTAYNGNITLKKHNVPVEFTKEDVENYLRCSQDIVYFAQNYVKIVHPDKGLINIDLYEFQEKLLRHLNESRNTILLSSRQSGKCFCNNINIRVRKKTLFDNLDKGNSNDESIEYKELELSIGNFFEMCRNFKDNKQE